MSEFKKLPDNAELVFKGKIFEVYHWEQKLYDGTTAKFERLKRANTTRVIPVVGDKILVLEQEQPDKPHPYLSLPGGRQEESEEPLESAKRELLEETGYKSSDWELWKKYDPYGKIIWTIYTFIARECKFMQEPKLDSGEKIECKLISFDDLLLLADNPNFHERDLKEFFLRARYDKKEREKLHHQLFYR